MKTLIIGLGVIGTTYGWALSEAGVDITHIVRKGRKETHSEGVELDVYDLRPGHLETQKVRYHPKVIDEVSPEDIFELVMAPTKHYQVADAIRELKDKVPSARFLIFTANWEGPQVIDNLLPRSRYVWGYSSSTGGHVGDTLMINMSNVFRFGPVDGRQTSWSENVVDLFGKADIKPDRKPNMIEWLWVHHAIAGGSIGAALYVGGLRELMTNPEALRNQLIPAVQDALRVVERRGIDAGRDPDTWSFLRQPAEKTVADYLKNSETTWVKRSFSASHFKENLKEMRRFYLDVLETGERLRVRMPYLNSFKEKIVGLTDGLTE